MQSFADVGRWIWRDVGSWDPRHRRSKYKNTFPRDSYLARYSVGEGVETWKEESPIVRSNYFAVITNIQKEEINDAKEWTYTKYTNIHQMCLESVSFHKIQNFRKSLVSSQIPPQHNHNSLFVNHNVTTLWLTSSLASRGLRCTNNPRILFYSL